MTPAIPPTKRRRHPFALLVLVGIMLFKSALILLVTLGSFALKDMAVLRFFRVEAIATAATATYLTGVGLLLLGLLLLGSALGLLAYRRLGWLLAMVTTGVFILFDIIGFMTGSANYFWMALNIVTVFYLNQREVRESVGALVDGSVDTATAGTVR